MSDSVNELMSGEAVYRTAPATPGLLKKIAGNVRHTKVSLGDLRESSYA